MSTTIRDALQEGKTRIAPVSETALLDAQLLLCEVLGVDRAYLILYDQQPLSEEQAARFGALVARAAAGEPVPYLLGRRAFYDRELIVTPDVLIPRPETELLLEDAIHWAKAKEPPATLPEVDAAPVAAPRLLAADIGTGSGALAVTFAAHVPEANVYAVDVSEAALNVARRNAEAQGVLPRITFLQGDLLAPLMERGIQLDLVMANLPYVRHDLLPALAVSRYEPHLALDGGADGLDLIRRLLAQLPAACKPGALILLEIGAEQGAAALALAQGLPLQSLELRKDYAGLDRIVRIVL